MSEKKCVFCGFLSGRKKEHKNGFPFMKLHETRHSVSFLSINFPNTEDGHTLVIPKKHFKNVEDIPRVIMNDVANHVQLIAKALRKKNSACNILLNDGKAANQTVWHAHFHLIPRNPLDKIIVEQWEHKDITPKEFVQMYSKIKKLIDKAK